MACGSAAFSLPLDRKCSSFTMADLPRVPTKIKLCGIPMKKLSADIVKSYLDARLSENRCSVSARPCSLVPSRIECGHHLWLQGEAEQRLSS